MFNSMTPTQALLSGDLRGRIIMPGFYLSARAIINPTRPARREATLTAVRQVLYLTAAPVLVKTREKRIRLV